MGRHRRLIQGFAGIANVLGAKVIFYGKGARLIIQLLTHVITDVAHLAAAGTAGRLKVVADLNGGQIGR